MKLLFKILSVFFILATLGHLTQGQIFFIGIILAGVFGYFGWKSDHKATEE